VCFDRDRKRGSFCALPRFPADHSIPPDTWRTISARDEAMANNALAVLAHAEGKSVLPFAHTGHILNAPMLGGRWSSQSRPPQSMGETLHRSVGSRYPAIAQIEPVTPPVDAPPDLVQLLHPKCKEPCMVAAQTEKGHRKQLPPVTEAGINTLHST
jgi:hypothetical protein